MKITKEMRERINTDKVRDYLAEYTITQTYVELLYQEVGRIESTKVKLTSVLSDMPKGNGKSVTDKWTEAIEDLAEVQKEMAVEAENLTKALETTYSAIKGLDNKDQRTVLGLRYVSGMKWKDIVNRLKGFYSERQIYRIHEDGLIMVHLQLFAE